MCNISGLHMYNRGHETRLTTNRRHSVHPETCTNTCSTYTNNIAEPRLAYRPQRMPRTLKAAGQLRRAADWIRGLAAKVIRDRKIPAQPTERNSIRQRLTEEVRKRFKKRRHHAGSRRHGSKQAHRQTHRRATPPVRQRRDVSVERKKAASIIAATARAFAKWVTSSSRGTLTPESLEILPSVEVPTTPPPPPQLRPENLSRKRANRHAIIIDNHLLEANGNVSEVWFAPEASAIATLCAPIHPLAIEPAGMTEISESVGDRAALPSERRRRGSGQAGLMEGVGLDGLLDRRGLGEKRIFVKPRTIM